MSEDIGNRIQFLALLCDSPAQRSGAGESHDSVLSYWHEQYHAPTAFLALIFASVLTWRWRWRDFRETSFLFLS